MKFYLNNNYIAGLGYSPPGYNTITATLQPGNNDFRFDVTTSIKNGIASTQGLLFYIYSGYWNNNQNYFVQNGPYAGGYSSNFYNINYFILRKSRYLKLCKK